MSSFNFITAICLSCITFITAVGCQQDKPKKPEEPNPVRRKSPTAIARALHPETNTYIKITYGQPSKRGRDIFGNIVAYNEVWRTGANETTEITTTEDIRIGGKELEAGTYSFFTIPRKDSAWTIIINSLVGQWGAFDYNKTYDVLRVEGNSRIKDKSTEIFTLQFSDIKDDSTNIVMEWDHTVVKVPITFIEKDSTSP
ncbi:DUF2911 domain-containing protein [Fodinibius halophilus]|uniref:DUF2911 domain-containing protein n=1 Tax=Fodinibius halophilus TaxID=1736908 RepID=A0A6M1T1Q7_9BACT|nr:DUF2911 domain-containing protein [Fodinibius halophilus]NGP87125.1 DUF2911 domain-containing protein [Fodinibius halophilus]